MDHAESHPDIKILRTELHMKLENIASEIRHLRELMQIDTARLGDFERLKAQSEQNQEEIRSLKTRTFMLFISLTGSVLTALIGFLLKRM